LRFGVVDSRLWSSLENPSIGDETRALKMEGTRLVDQLHRIEEIMMK
jgi:hypothetical protein